LHWSSKTPQDYRRCGKKSCRTTAVPRTVSAVIPREQQYCDCKAVPCKSLITTDTDHTHKQITTLTQWSGKITVWHKWMLIETIHFTFHMLHNSTTVKPLMFECPLFREFRESKKTAKIKGTKTDTIPTLISIGVENLWLAHHQTTGCSFYVYVSASSNARLMAEQWQCLINKFFKPTSSDLWY